MIRGVEPARCITGENCQGQPENYWRSTAWDSEGKCLLGHGMTKEQAEQDAANKLAEREKFLALQDPEKLQKMLEGRMSSDDYDRAIRVMARMLLKLWKARSYGGPYC